MAFEETGRTDRRPAGPSQGMLQAAVEMGARKDKVKRTKWLVLREVFCKQGNGSKRG